MDIPWQQWLQDAVFWLIRAALALLLLWIGSRYARKGREWVKGLMRNERLPVTISESIVRIASELTFVGIWIFLLALALILVGVPAQTVVIAIAILIGVVLYALRESLANFASTVIFVIFQTFKRGETIETMGYMGTVYDIEVFNTVLLAFDQRLITLPNAKIQEEGVVNYSRMETSRINVQFLVAYGEDIAKVSEIVLGVLAKDPLVRPDPAPSVNVFALNVTGVTMDAWATVAVADRGKEINAVRGAIIEELIAQGIRFPTPVAALPAP